MPRAMRCRTRFFCLLALAAICNGARTLTEIDFWRRSGGHGRHLTLLNLNLDGDLGLQGFPAWFKERLRSAISRPNDPKKPSGNQHGDEGSNGVDLQSTAPELIAGEPVGVMRESEEGFHVSTQVTFVQSGDQYGLIVIPLQETESVVVECDDRPPEGATCMELVNFNGCELPVIISNGICRMSCGACHLSEQPGSPSNPTEHENQSNHPDDPSGTQTSDAQGNGAEESTDTSVDVETSHPTIETPVENPKFEQEKSEEWKEAERNARAKRTGVNIGDAGEEWVVSETPSEINQGADANTGEPSENVQNSEGGGSSGGADTLIEIEIPPSEEKSPPPPPPPPPPQMETVQEKEIEQEKKEINLAPEVEKETKELPLEEPKENLPGPEPEEKNATQSDAEPIPESSVGEGVKPDESGESGECKSATEILDSREDLSFMAELFKAAQNPLLKTVGDKSFVGTLFAPTNDAFDKALSELGITREALLTGNPRFSEVVLDAHVVPGLPRTNFSAGQEFPTVTARFDIFVKSDDKGGVQIVSQGDRAANILESDIAACESIVHVIDNVLFPQSLESTKEMFLAESGGPAAG